MILSNESQLRELYKQPQGKAKIKVMPQLEIHTKNFIRKSPFVILATANNDGKMDASPRGGLPGFVKIVNERELVIPDYKGNNRVDSLSNIVETENLGMLFLIPGIDETLRVNGTAVVSTSEEVLRLFDSESKKPISCIVVAVEEIFLHCAKAFMHSKLWNEESQMDSSKFPTMGQMLNDQLNIDGPTETRKEMIERYTKDI